MHPHSLITALRRPRWQVLALALAAGLHLSCKSRPESESSGVMVIPVPQHGLPSQSQPAAEAHSGLRRSPEAIAVNIARKKAKLAGEKGATNPDGYARYRYIARLGSDGTIPPDALMRAKQQAEAMPVIQPQGGAVVMDAGIWNWEWLGPGNIGGRIRSILIHPTTPDTMWIGGVSGGIWKTTDGGASWTPINDFLPSLAVGHMVMDPTNPNIMYAGTGEGLGGSDKLPGAGVFKSTDGGMTWPQLPDTIPTSADPGVDPFGQINRLAIHPTNGQILLAATHWGIFRTTDGGTTWAVNRTYSARTDDVDFDPTNGSRAIGGTRNNTVVRSSDSGQSWQEVGLGSDANTTLAQAFNPNLDGEPDKLQVVSTAGFNVDDLVIIGYPSSGTWENAKVVAVEAPNGQLVVAEEGPTVDLENSYAAGVSVRIRRRVEAAYAPSNPTIVYAVRDYNAGEVYRSTDRGATFARVGPSGLIGGQGWYDNVVWVAPDDPNLVVIGGVDLHRSTDGGNTFVKISDWRRYHSPGDSAHADQHVIVARPNYGVANRTVFFGNDGGIQKVSNILTATATTGWTNLANNLGVTQFYGGAAAPDGSVIVGGTQDNDNLRYRPQDGAQGWYQAETGDGAFCAIDFVDPSIIYTQYWGHRIEKSTNGGLSYFRVVDGITDLGAGFSVSPLVMDPSNRFILYTGGGEIIWRTTDAAGEWTAVRQSIGVDDWVACFDVAPNGEVWAGYRFGTVSKSPPAMNWVDVDNNGPTPLPNNRMVTEIAINPSNSSEVWVTFGGYEPDQVWLTKDSGQTWQSRSAGLPTIQVNTIRVHPGNGDWIYIGTDLGVFASEDEGLTWSRTPRFSANEGPVNTEVAELFWQGDRLIAATHGRGMYRVRPMAVVYVDWRNGGSEDGSLTYPYNTVIEGIDAAGHGTNLSIHAGDYNETGQVVFNKRGNITATSGAVNIR